MGWRGRDSAGLAQGQVNAFVDTVMDLGRSIKHVGGVGGGTCRAAEATSFLRTLLHCLGKFVNNRCLFVGSDENHKYILWASCRSF
jgi:hypothetical protein